MRSHRKRHLLAPLLALSMTLATAASVHAQDRQYSGGTSERLEINFGTQPYWVAVPGTRVRAISLRERTDYDMFRYDRYYYAYNHDNGRWYRSRNWRGQFLVIDDRYVPRDLSRVPRNRWRNYPAAWANDRNQGSGRYQDQGRYQNQGQNNSHGQNKNHGK
jgi:hypothetical protein